jgi:mannose-6-phosphate isomerase
VEALNSGHIMDILNNREDVKAGDVFFLPAGRVHTIGKGLLLPKYSKHLILPTVFTILTVLMIKATNANCIPKKPLPLLTINITLNIKPAIRTAKERNRKAGKCPYFTTNVLNATTRLRSKDYSALDSFVIHVCIEGRVYP